MTNNVTSLNLTVRMFQVKQVDTKYYQPELINAPKGNIAICEGTKADVSQHHQSSAWTFLSQLHHTSHTLSHFVSCVNIYIKYTTYIKYTSHLMSHVTEDLSHIGGKFVSILMLFGVHRSVKGDR